MTDHPYRHLPDSHYWRRAMGRWSLDELEGSFEPAFEIGRSNGISSLGSCFAQHVGRHLRTAGIRYLDFEPAPTLLPEEFYARHGYGLFSCRSGNIYSSRQLLQFFQRAFGEFDAPMIYERDGRFYDAYRPTIEPDGFSSREELLIMRDAHERAARRMFCETDVLIFTMGLTEIWLEKRTGAVFPVVPGVAGGDFDPAEHVFSNLGFTEVYNDMETVIVGLRKQNPALNILLTVSPVPLAATASGRHIAVATTYSKAVLRAVAGEICAHYDYIDYFPSFELVTASAFSGRSFETDLRSVKPETVDRIMRYFLHVYGLSVEMVSPSPPPNSSNDLSDMQRNVAEMKVVCDEEKLDIPEL